jgi:hypothetical protein
MTRAALSMENAVSARYRESGADEVAAVQLTIARRGSPPESTDIPGLGHDWLTAIAALLWLR